MRRGDGDDDDDIEGDFDAWKGELLSSLAGTPLLGFASKEEEAAATNASAPVTPSAAAASLPPLPSSPQPRASPATPWPPPRRRGRRPVVASGGDGRGTALAGPRPRRRGPGAPLAALGAQLHPRRARHRCRGGRRADLRGRRPHRRAAVDPGRRRGRGRSALGLDPKAMVEISIPSSGSSSSSSSDLSRAPCEASPCSVSDAIARFADVLGPVPKAGVAAFAAFAASAKDSSEELAKLSELLAPTPAGMAAYKKWHAHSRCVARAAPRVPEDRQSLTAGRAAGRRRRAEARGQVLLHLLLPQRHQQQ